MKKVVMANDHGAVELASRIEKHLLDAEPVDLVASFLEVLLYPRCELNCSVIVCHYDFLHIFLLCEHLSSMKIIRKDGDNEKGKDIARRAIDHEPDSWNGFGEAIKRFTESHEYLASVGTSNMNVTISEVRPYSFPCHGTNSPASPAFIAIGPYGRVLHVERARLSASGQDTLSNINIPIYERK